MSDGKRMIAPERLSAGTLSPERLSAAEAVMDARKYVGDMAETIGWQRLRECIELSLPQILAIIAVAEGTLPYDERLTKLLGSLHSGQKQVARYLVECTPQKVIVTPPNA